MELNIFTYDKGHCDTHVYTMLCHHLFTYLNKMPTGLSFYNASGTGDVKNVLIPLVPAICNSSLYTYTYNSTIESQYGFWHG